ncbi:MAG: RNA-guided endonuclease TnpB family protein [Lutibacter sp.]|jgi:putative transposase
MYKSYLYRLYPTKEQEILLDKHFGCVRLVYNLALECKQLAYKSQTKRNFTTFDLIYQIPELKEEFPFLKEINSHAFNAALSNLESAYNNFFRGITKFPKYKSRKSQQSFQCPDGSKINFEAHLLKITKFKEGIKYRGDQIFEGKIKTVTIKKTNTGKYFASVLVDDGKELPIKSEIQEQTTIGIDVGLKNFCVLSTGEKINNPKFLQSQLTRLAILQRRASRKKRGSKNQKKAYRKVSLLHEKIKNQRTNFIHKLTSRITCENQTIAIEDLNVRGMVKNRHLSQAISDVSWSEFFRQLRYKSDWYGKNLLQIGRFEPSSKMCSCGVINNNLTLSDRTWTCESCGVIHDRDILAAQNIKRFALINEFKNNTPVGSRGELLDVRCSKDRRMKEECLVT